MNVGQTVVVQVGMKMKKGTVRSVEGSVIVVALARMDVTVDASQTVVL